MHLNRVLSSTVNRLLDRIVQSSNTRRKLGRLTHVTELTILKLKCWVRIHEAQPSYDVSYALLVNSRLLLKSNTYVLSYG